MKYRICVLTNENRFDHEQWEISLQKSPDVLFYDVVSLVADDWFLQLTEKEYDLFLLRPPGRTELFKRLYDERVSLICEYFSTPVYPSMRHVLIYENKRALRDWLLVTGLPHPETFVFFSEQEALDFVERRDRFPLVGKTNIGASGNGVQILNSRTHVKEYVKVAFSVGIRPRTGPKLTKGSLLEKLRKAIKKKGFLRQRFSSYIPTAINYQHFVILQEFIPHDFEWRCVRIGDSYFAHKKVAHAGKASGRLIKAYDPVPLRLLDFIRTTTEKHELNCASIDLFERGDQFLINEVQCFFGQSDPYQMLVNGKAGRYTFDGTQWTFEEGMFNSNECYDLRLEHAISILENR